MVSSSSQQAAATDASAKALYLAESGFRYAESRWNPYDTEAVRHDALDTLDGNYTLSGDDGQFELKLYSYFLEMAQDTSGSGPFKAHFPGSIPDDLSPGSIPMLRVGNQTVTVSAAHS
jgi:hypothetical protein